VCGRLFVHEMEPLAAGAARRLFRQAAGLGAAPEAGLQEVEGDILRACGGRPLALQHMGGSLCGRSDAASWRVRRTPTLCVQGLATLLGLHLSLL
jgi:hypothetical protein